MASEKYPKLKLGLKKKTEGDHQSKTTEGRSRLTLGLRKKVAAISQKENIELPKRDRPTLSINKANITQPTQVAHPKFNYDQSRKREVIPQELSSGKKRSTIKMSQTIGKLEVSIKIQDLPNRVETMKHNWKRFWINAEDQVVQMTVRPKTWKKLLEASQEYPTWRASITGKMGVPIRGGFILLYPSIQIHEITQKI